MALIPALYLDAVVALAPIHRRDEYVGVLKG